MKRIAIAGDIVIDWNLARERVIERSAALWDPDYRMRTYPPEIGGAALIKTIIKQAANQEYDVDLAGPYPTKEDLFPENRHYSHSYTICSRSGPAIWQVEAFLGLDKAQVKLEDDTRAEAAQTDLILIDDGNSGFRERFSNDAWPSSVPIPGEETWILLKWARPDFRVGSLEKNRLWRQLRTRYAKQLIVVFTANDLRLTEMQIGRELSWEQTAQDVMREIKESTELRGCAAVVVSFYTSGAVVFWNHPSQPGCKFYYDPSGIEGEWFIEHPGRMVGYTQCLVAGIAHCLIRDGVTSKSLGYGTCAGLAASRELHTKGFSTDDGAPFPGELRFPIAHIAETIRSTGIGQDVFRDETIDEAPEWSLAKFDHSQELADKIILTGPGLALKKMSVCQFGGMITVDRIEAESLRSVSALIAEYARNRSLARPLSIAVFGSPGSGKSFAVQQVMETLRNRSDLKKELGEAKDQREFNLSQFRNSEDLLGALHQIRDAALSGRIPLVFWDEFDAAMDGQPLGWLRYFLSPMQDGKFQQGQVTHLTGRAVFVFAGGTSSNIKEFESSAQANKSAKGPDFLSRLKGFIDIPSLNHPGSTPDPLVIVRRAILFRSMLERRSVPNLFRSDGNHKTVDVDQAVSRAFLNVGHYKHGARSMESIISMSLLDGKRLFEQSSLPSKHLLDLHVNSDEFIGLVRKAS